MVAADIFAGKVVMLVTIYHVGELVPCYSECIDYYAFSMEICLRLEVPWNFWSPTISLLRFLLHMVRVLLFKLKNEISNLTSQFLVLCYDSEWNAKKNVIIKLNQINTIKRQDRVANALVCCNSRAWGESAESKVWKNATLRICMQKKRTCTWCGRSCKDETAREN
jgi:hypothetical protein